MDQVEALDKFKLYQKVIFVQQRFTSTLYLKSLQANSLIGLFIELDHSL